MPFVSSRTCVAAAAFMLSAGVAQADLAPADVWGDWREYMQGLGYSISGTESAAGDTLTVSDITISMDLADAAENVTMSLGTMAFRQQGDGSVSIEMPDSMPVSVGFTPAGEDPVRLDMTFDQTGHSMIASGTPADLTYAYQAQTMAFMLNKLEVDNTVMGPDAMKMAVTGTNVSSTTRVQIGNLRSYVQDMQIGNVKYDVAMQPPDAPGENFKMQGELTGLRFDGTTALPSVLVQSDNITKMIEAGFAMDGQMVFDSNQAAADFNGPDGGFQMTSQSQGGTFDVAMSEKGVRYGATSRNVDMTGRMSDFPFPVSIQMSETLFNLVMPAMASDETQDFALALKLGDFTISDVIWGLFDPAGQLPRDPATIDLDLSGKATVGVNFLDPEAIETFAASGEQPGTLEALTLNKLLVSLVGAQLSGTGDFTFDNNDLATFDGIPRPIGGVNLQLIGGNALLDKLSAMGFVGEEEAMGARMMMGLFAVPGDTPDTLNSQLEINAEGHILANGQRIQ